MTVTTTNLLTRALNNFDLQTNPNAVSGYVDSLQYKNENIKRLFENYPDGRIVLNAKELCSLDSVLNFSLDISKEETRELISDIRYKIVRNTSLSASETRVLINGFLDVLCSPYLDTKTKKIQDENGILSSIKGMKIGKVLNLILDNNIIREHWVNLEKSDIDYIRNNIIGGEIASLIDNASAASDSLSLVLSINPLDFLTMSCGTSWDSCMYPNGEYSSGTLPYSTGRDTVIGFLVDTNDYYAEIERSGWTNKIWRQIMYVTDDNFIVSQNPYPGDKPKFSIALSAYINDALNLDLDITAAANEKNRDSLYVNNIGLSTGYVDLDHGGYIPFIFGNSENRSKVEVEAQTTAFCLGCGKTATYLADSCGVCDSCDESYDAYCDCCDEGFYSDDEGGYTSDGDMVCQACLDDLFVYSEFHEGYIRSDSAVEVYNISKRWFSGDYSATVDFLEKYILNIDAIKVSEIKGWEGTPPYGLGIDDYVFKDSEGLKEVLGDLVFINENEEE